MTALEQFGGLEAKFQVLFNLRACFSYSVTNYVKFHFSSGSSTTSNAYDDVTIFENLCISQKHKNIDISRTKHHFFFKYKISLITHQGLLYGKKFHFADLRRSFKTGRIFRFLSSVYILFDFAYSVYEVL